MSWEGEIFGVGMMEAMAGMYPEHADEATACATMEWFNIHVCEEFGHEAGVHVSLEQAEKLGREGAQLARRHSFEKVAKLTMEETPAAHKMYKELAKGARTPELKAFAEGLVDHENALRDWLKSEVDGKPDCAEKVFAYLERNGITRGQAREAGREERHGDRCRPGRDRGDTQRRPVSRRRCGRRGGRRGGRRRGHRRVLPQGPEGD